MGSGFNDFSTLTTSDDGFISKEMRAENDANGNAIYVGHAKAGSATSDSVWLIRKFTYDANDAATRAQIANNTLGFKFVWNDRATYF